MGKIIAYYINHHIGRMFNTKQVMVHEPRPLDFPVPTTRQITKGLLRSLYIFFNHTLVINILRKAKKPVMIVGSQACYLPSVYRTAHNEATLQVIIFSLDVY